LPSSNAAATSCSYFVCLQYENRFQLIFRSSVHLIQRWIGGKNATFNCQLVGVSSTPFNEKSLEQRFRFFAAAAGRIFSLSAECDYKHGQSLVNASFFG
jgi:hypothetical protein